MPVEWDPQKVRINLEKHEIACSDAVSALEDDYALTIEDDHPHKRRYVTLGMDLADRLLVVVWLYHGEVIRLNFARRATSKEQRNYQAGEP